MELLWTAVEITVSQSVDRALVDRHGLVAVSVATERWLRASVRRLVAFLGHDPGVDRLTPQEVSRWVQHEIGRGVSAVYVNSCLRAVKTLYSRLERNGVVGSNPALPVHFLAEPRPSPRGIAEGDYLAMRGAATNTRDRAIVDVLWASGCRLGGLLSMRVDRMERWRDGDRDCFALLVVEKYDRPRWVYVGRRAAEGRSLADWLSERPRLGPPGLFLAFDLPLRTMSAQAVQHVLRKLKTAAGIPRSRPCNAHAFRHAFAIRMLDEGEDLAAVSAWLGHATPEFTAAVYAVRPEWALREKYFAV